MFDGIVEAQMSELLSLEVIEFLNSSQLSRREIFSNYTYPV